MLRRLLYDGVLVPLALGLAWSLAALNPRLRANLVARRGLAERLAVAAQRRDTARPLVWFHVASAGEYLQAEPLLRRFRAHGCQVAVTLTSVSGLRWLQRIADWPELVYAGMAPFDRCGDVRALLGALRPSVQVLVQADLWPNLVLETRARGIPQVLIAARIGAGATYRRRWPLRGLYRTRYGGLDGIAALSAGDRERLAALAPGHGRLCIAGDPGIESVLQRVQEARSAPATAALEARWPRHGTPRLIAGSIWPQDEMHLLPVLRDALHEWPRFTALLVPHEPHEAHLRVLEAALAPLTVARLSQLEAGAAGGGDSNAPPRAGGASPDDVSAAGAGTAAQEARVVLVDSIGRLAGLYALAGVAYVGGGFSSGVHNVAEPAAAGLPVLFGPRHGKSPLAQALREAGGGFAVSDGPTLRAALWPLLRDEASARTAGERARSLVAGLAGAVERCEALILEVAPALAGPIRPPRA